MHGLKIVASGFCAFMLAAAVVPGTTAAPLKGSGLHAIVDGNGWLLGASKNGHWITKPNLMGSRSYTIYGFKGRLGSVTTGKPVSLDAPCPDQTGITAELPEGAVVGIEGTWNALPRMPRSQDTNQPAYRAIVKQFLQNHGIKKPEIQIDHIVRCDLDNDGTDEVVISAHRYKADQDIMASAGRDTDQDAAFQIHTADVKAGDYAIVLLRKIYRGKVITIPLAGEFYPKARKFVAPSVYQVQGMFDLRGDGRMQILLGSRYYEGEGTQVFDIRGLKAESVLGSGCGA